MLERWAAAYAERWGLPEPALDELRGVFTAVQRGEIAGGQVDTLEGASDVDEDEPRPIATEPEPDAGTRYEDIGYIGMGGMGEVRRVWDCSMNRSLAMKILRKELVQRVDLVARFREEAEATAQLEHPCVVPIHDLGTLADGRMFFTMKEVRGRTFLDVIDEVHTASVDGWATGPSGWSLVKLVQAFVSVCECIAYAHSRSVLHRDLKPSNVMVGAFGEVAVMDWGLAKIKAADKGFGDSVAMGSGTGPVITGRSREGWVTRHGSIAGTPNYMPPEQATGDHGKVGPWSDVYALGAILYHILADRPPYDGYEVDAVVKKVLATPPPAPLPPWRDRSRTGAAGVEDGLIAICEKAMARDLAHRYMDAATLAEAVQAWLEGARVREQALALVARADAIEPDILDLRRTAAGLRARAEQRLRAVPPTAPAEQKRPAWDLQDEATAIEGELADLRARYAHLLHAALAWLPDLPEARYRLSSLHADKAKGGVGYVTLHTDEAVEVDAHPVHVVGRRRVEGEPVPLGMTPLDRVPLPAGDWMLRAGDLAMPIQVVSGEHWTGARPGSTRTLVHRVRPLPYDAVMVPAGWTRLGGDIEREDALPLQKIWVDGFAIQRHPVRCDAFLEFLRDLDAGGHQAGADAHVPTLDGVPLWVRHEGTWELPEGWRPDQPVRAVTWEAAAAYAEWFAGRTGRPWRLPTEIQWEKAARGTDERSHPWGDHADPTWCCVADSHTGPAQPAPVGAYPADVSPYGVRGLGGNVRDWCISTSSPTGLPVDRVAANDRIVRGGHWLGIGQFARCALRYRVPTPTHPGVGFRLVHPIEDPEDSP